jgi:hypothetical protein
VARRTHLLSLDEVDFAEAKFDDLLIEVFRAGLRTLEEQGDLVIPDAHLQLLFSRVSGALREALTKVIQVSALSVAEQGKSSSARRAARNPISSAGP